MRCTSWTSSGESSFSLSSGCPARMIRSTFSFVVSTPDSRRISSSTRFERFCASSTISITFRPAAYCSTRNWLRVAISSALRILKGVNPNCTSTACRNSIGETCVWATWATTTSLSSSRRNVSSSVVLPEPISPVITTKPSVNQIVDSMYALARAWCFDRYRNAGSGLSRNGSSVSWKCSRYMSSYRLAQRKWRLMRGNQSASQLLRDPVPQGPSGGDDRHVAELAARPFRLAVIVPVQFRPGQELACMRLAADDVDHGGVAARRGAAERQSRDGAHVVLELAGLRALDGPVAGVVHARRHLACDQPPALDEVFDAEHADVAERMQQAPVIAFGEALQPHVRPRCARHRENAVDVHIFGERVIHHGAGTVARGDEREFAGKPHQALVDERLPGEAPVGVRGVTGAADADLALAVIAEATRLQDAGRAERRDGALEVGDRVHCGVGRDRDGEALEHMLL